MANYITEEDVRNFVLDRNIEDNDLLLDLAFSPEEIEDAMKRAAREWNSIPPYVSTADPSKLDASMNLFLDAIAQQLYISELNKLMRNDIDYTAGGVGTNLEQKRISHLRELISFHGDRFRQAARDIKIALNLNQTYMHF